MRCHFKSCQMEQLHWYKITELLENSMWEECKMAAYANRLWHTSLGDRKLWMTTENMEFWSHDLIPERIMMMAMIIISSFIFILYKLYCLCNYLPTNFDICKSVHHHMIQINQPTKCNSFTSLLLDVYVWLNMFRAPLRPSSGAYNKTIILTAIGKTRGS